MKSFRNFMVVFTFFKAIVCLGGEANAKVEKGNWTANVKTWAGLTLDSLILDLQSNERVIWLLFHADGYVSVTVGKKGGGLAGPVCPWKVNGEWMQIFDEGESKPWFQIRVLKRADKTITVENQDGEKQIFAIKKR